MTDDRGGLDTLGKQISLTGDPNADDDDNV